MEYTAMEALLPDLHSNLHALRGQREQVRNLWTASSLSCHCRDQECAKYYHKRNTNIPVNEKRYQRLQAERGGGGVGGVGGQRVRIGRRDARL